MADQDVILRLALALVLGGAIGLERRWRGHEAGPHTNALVAAGAALFVMAGIIMAGDAGARFIAQVASGVGFLAGGVILRDGFHVRGLNTAGTIWCVAALGCLIGLGRLVVAIEATAVIIIANGLFHLIEHKFKIFRNEEEDTGDIKVVREKRKP
jgi:putative Mg2+ transporter-C (MgtC) family protein